MLRPRRAGVSPRYPYPYPLLIPLTLLRPRRAGVSRAAWRAIRLARSSEKKGTLAWLGVGVGVGGAR